MKRVLHSTPTQRHTLNSCPLNIGGRHFDLCLNIQVHTQSTKDVIAYIFPYGISHHLKTLQMKDAQESI